MGQDFDSAEEEEEEICVSSNSSLRSEALTCLRTTLAEVESALVSAAWDPEQRLRVVDLAALVTEIIVHDFNVGSCLKSAAFYFAPF